jgi:hypothetical protein
MGTDIREAMEIAKKQIEARKADEKYSEEAQRIEREFEERNKPTFKNIIWHYFHNTDSLKSLLFADLFSIFMFLWIVRILLHQLGVWPIVR